MQKKIMVDLCGFSSLEQEKIYRKLIETSYICVVKYWALWCKPCRDLSKQIEDEIINYSKIYDLIQDDITLDGDYTNSIVFLKINIDIHDDLANSHDITKIPHIFIYHKGKLEKEERNFSGILQYITSKI